MKVSSTLCAGVSPSRNALRGPRMMAPTSPATPAHAAAPAQRRLHVMFQKRKLATEGLLGRLTQENMAQENMARVRQGEQDATSPLGADRVLLTGARHRMKGPEEM